MSVFSEKTIECTQCTNYHSLRQYNLKNSRNLVLNHDDFLIILFIIRILHEIVKVFIIFFIPLT